MAKSKSTPWWVWLIVVVIVLIVIIVFVASLGTVDVENQLPQEFKDSKDEALKKHKALLAELDKKKALKEKLARRFKYSYLTVRILLVIICSVSIYYLGYLLGAQTLGDFLNYYEASIIFLFALNFIAFGTIANFHDFIHVLRTKVENWVWSKHINLPKEIDSMTKEIETLNGQIEGKPTTLSLPTTTEIKQVIKKE
jgi:p-aminobenzoyl-glutamate transporter AbgT